MSKKKGRRYLCFKITITLQAISNVLPVIHEHKEAKCRGRFKFSTGETFLVLRVEKENEKIFLNISVLYF